MHDQIRKPRIVDEFLQDLDREAAITERLLDILPDDKLAWRPHPKARSLGELAMHIAINPGAVAEMTLHDVFEIDEFPADPPAVSRKQILDIHSDSLGMTHAALDRSDDLNSLSVWKCVLGGKIVVESRRIDYWRTILIGHTIHHRGQLSVYLRELNVPIPSIYGPSADTK